MSEETKVRKPRIKRSPEERAVLRKEKLQKLIRSVSMDAAKNVVKENFGHLEEAVVLHKKYAFEGKGLTDLEALQKRRENLQRRLENLNAKAAIASRDYVRRTEVLEKFEAAKAEIGTYTMAQAEKSETPNVAVLEEIISRHLSDEEYDFLLDVSDPYAAFRRPKKEVVESTGLSDSDED